MRAFRAIHAISAVLCLMATLCVPLARAQSSGATTSAATGTVRDSAGVVIGGATVMARELKTNITREVTTNEDGSFVITQLRPGDYEVIASASGFSQRAINTTLTVGITALLNFNLDVAASDFVVVVEAGAASIEGRTERATNIESDRIEGLPINRRNFLDFSLTTAGVTPNRVPAEGPAATSGLSFNGQSARQNNITIDGLDNNELFNGQVRQTFSQDAVQEFQVVGANYSAEFGRALGGVVNIVTKGGSNELHGTLFNFIRNDELSARDAFSPFKPEFKQYQFGATLGGPIKKDKAFFFTSFERLSLKQNNIVFISDDFVASARRRGFSVSNGPIPFSRATTQFLARGDVQLTSNDRINFRYNYGGAFDGALQPFGGLRADTSGGKVDLNDNTIAVSNTYISSSLNLVNETRFLFTRRDIRTDPLDTRGPAVNLFAPEGLIIFGRDPLLPQENLTRIYEIIDNVSLTRGRHQIKTGFDFIFSRTPELSIPVLFGGLAVYSPLDFSQVLGIPGLPAFSAMQFFDPALRTPAQQAFLTIAAVQLPIQFPGFPRNLPLTQLSIPLAFLQGFGNPVTPQDSEYLSAFVQDDIRVKPYIIFKLGLRYDRERIDGAPENDGNFSPRFSFFYRPNDNQRFSIFGSYGIFHGTTQTSPATVTKFLDGKTVVTPVLPFPFSIISQTLPGGRFPNNDTLPPGLPVIPQLARNTVLDPNMRNGYAHQVNFGVNYLINDKTGVSATYQLVRGLKLFLARNINPIVRPIPNDPVLSAITGRIDPTQGELISFETSGDSYYNAATFSFFTRATRRFSVLAHYTFAKAIDNFVDPLRVDIVEIQNPLNLREERGLSLQDVRSRFVFSGTYDTGSMRNPYLRDFQFSSIITLSSGTPFNLLAGADLDGNGDNPPADRPNRIGRNLGRGPGFASVDVRVARSLRLGERVRLTGYAEAFNLFNRKNIDRINSVFPARPDGTFNLPPMEDGRFIATPDRFVSAFRPREFQLGFRLTF